MAYREGPYNMHTRGGGRIAGVVFQNDDGTLEDFECIRVNGSLLISDDYDLEPKGPSTRLSVARRAELLALYNSLPKAHAHPEPEDR